MQEEQVFTAVLNRAAQIGALQPVEQHATDLGIGITVKAALFDSIRTIVGFEITDDTMGYVPSKASLLDYENNMSYSLLSVKKIESGNPFPWFLEFEPVADGAGILTLTIEEMQVVESGSMPLVKISTLYDPWDNSEQIPPEVYEKLEAWRAELIPEKEEIPPVWECSGQWRFTLNPTLEYRAYYCKESECYVKLPILDQEILISKIATGLSGSLITCDSLPKIMEGAEYETWKGIFIDNILQSRNPMEFAERMKSDEMGLFRPLFFKLTIISKDNGYAYPSTGSGPWGVFSTRLYYMCDCVEETTSLELQIEELFNVAPKNPIILPVEIRDIDENQEQNFELKSPFISLYATFSVKELHYDEEYLIINHDVSIITGNVQSIRFREVKLLDKYDVPYNPIDKSSHWSEKHGVMLRGFTFPPVHYRGGMATLEVRSVDLAPIVPFKFDATM